MMYCLSLLLHVLKTLCELLRAYVFENYKYPAILNKDDANDTRDRDWRLVFSGMWRRVVW
jgi:hypothetical protein